jgi:hypothetical protein
MPIVLIRGFFSLSSVLITVFFVSDVTSRITIKTIIERNFIKYCKIGTGRNTFRSRCCQIYFNSGIVVFCRAK